MAESLIFAQAIGLLTHFKATVATGGVAPGASAAARTMAFPGQCRRALSSVRSALTTPGGRSDFSAGGLSPVRPIRCPLGRRDCLQPQSRQCPASSSPMRKAPPKLPAKIQATTPRRLLTLPPGRAVDDPANGGGVSVLGYRGAYPPASLIRDQVLFMVETYAARQGLPRAKKRAPQNRPLYDPVYLGRREIRFGHRSNRAAILGHRRCGWTEPDHCILDCSRTQ